MSKSLFNKVADLQLYYNKKRLQHRCFPVNIEEFSRTRFLHITPPVAASEPT